jgi:hypothetical protein
MSDASLLALKPGERRVYHQGHLSSDCLTSPHASRMRTEAQIARERGRVFLFQRRSRKDTSEFEYIAVGR